MENKIDKGTGLFEDMLSRYMRGEMSEEEEREFRKLLEDDAELRDQATATARLVKAMDEVGRENDRKIIERLRDASWNKAAAIAAGACGADGKKSGKLLLRRVVVSLSVAATILVCLFGGYRYYVYERATGLSMEYLSCFPLAEYSRGARDDVEKQLRKYYAKVEQGEDLEAAITELRELWEESKGDTYNDYTEYMPQIGWILVNAYLRNNDRRNALTVLDTLISEFPEGTVLGDKARELAGKIEKL